MATATTPPQQTLDQRRAKHAYDTVETFLKANLKTSDKAKKFGGQAKKMPTRCH